MKTTKTEVKKQPIKIEQPQPQASAEVLHDAQQDSSYFNDLLESVRAMGIFIPSWKRAVVSLLASMATGFMVGKVLGSFTAFLMLATFAATSSAFLMYVVAAIGLLISVYAGIKLASKVGMYIATSSIDQDAAAAWSWTKSLFVSDKPKLATA